MQKNRIDDAAKFDRKSYSKYTPIDSSIMYRTSWKNPMPVIIEYVDGKNIRME